MEGPVTNLSFLAMLDYLDGAEHSRMLTEKLEMIPLFLQHAPLRDGTKAFLMIDFFLHYDIEEGKEPFLFALQNRKLLEMQVVGVPVFAFAALAQPKLMQEFLTLSKESFEGPEIDIDEAKMIACYFDYSEKNQKCFTKANLGS